MTNSATSLFHHNIHGNMVRIGIGLYGLNPSSSPSAKDLDLPYDLSPALSLTSELVFVKEITPEMGVSYGATYKAEKKVSGLGQFRLAMLMVGREKCKDSKLKLEMSIVRLLDVFVWINSWLNYLSLTMLEHG